MSQLRSPSIDAHGASIDNYASLDGAGRAIPRVTMFCLSFIAIALWGNVFIELSRFF
jgi:hypothetical protein